MIRLLPLCSAGCVGQLRYVWLGLHEYSCTQWCYLTPCNLKLVLGNWATELGGSAEHNCAQQRWCQSANLSGGLADGRLSETFDATLDQIRWRQRQSCICAVLPAFVSMLPLRGIRRPCAAIFQHGESGWGERLRRGEGWTTEAPSRSLLALFSDSHTGSAPSRWVQSGALALSLSLLSERCRKHKGS